MRAITQKTLKYFKDNHKAIFKKHNSTYGTREDDVYKSEDGYRCESNDPSTIKIQNKSLSRFFYFAEKRLTW
jgi:hypothetical protein